MILPYNANLGRIDFSEGTGVAAERKPLEIVARPLTFID